MRKVNARLVALAVATFVLIVGGSAALGSRFDGFAGNWVVATASEQEQIAVVLRDTMRARAVAARSFDVSGIRANVVDDPAAPLTGKQRANLARLDPSAEPRGQLTLELAFFARWQRGDEAFQRAQQARLAGRQPEQADLSAAMPRRSDPIYELPLAVHAVRISGSRAYIEAETEAIHYRVTLVKRGDRWFIAGEDNTSKI